MPAYQIARLGMAHVVEGRGVFSSLTVEENLTLAFRQRAGASCWPPTCERAYAAFPILGERRRQMAGTLSGGQQRLLSLAKVLVVPPQVLMADELSLGLAPVVVDAVYEGLREINRQRDRAGGGRAAGRTGCSSWPARRSSSTGDRWPTRASPLARAGRSKPLMARRERPRRAP